jgi:hypothetical protein
MTDTLTRAEWDRLLELVGECRHGEWRDGDWNAATCGKCGRRYVLAPGECLPAVGDGRELPADQIAKLWLREDGYIRLYRDGDGYQAVVGKRATGDIAFRYGRNVTAALGRAVLAADKPTGGPSNDRRE